MEQEAARTDVRISLICVISPNRGFDTIFDTLRSFQPQDGNISWQFIVAHIPDAGRADQLQSEFPWVERIEGKDSNTIPTLRNLALRKARGQYIAFVDDHIFFPRDYLQGIDTAARRGFRIFGGIVENANPETIHSWTHYFCEYSKWLPIVKEGPVTDLPGSNFVVESRLLSSYRPFPEQGFGLETHFFEQCRRDRHQPHFVHDFRIRHLHVEKISTFWRFISFNYGVWFGRIRGFGLLKRMCYAAAFPLTALVLYLRVFKNVMRSPEYLGHFLLSTPLLLLTFAIRSAGEAVGYMRGAP